jgi:hypothetical protein
MCLLKHRSNFAGWNKQMNQDIKDNIAADNPEKIFALLSSVMKDPILTVRDDLYDFSLLLDAVKLHRKHKLYSRFRLVDSGALSLLEVEWLASEGADVYTNDEVGKTKQELENIRHACKKGHSLLAYHSGALLESDEDVSIGLSDLKDLGASGVYIYISDKDQEHGLSGMILLADSCRRGQSRLVYYNHRELDPALFELGRAGTWIHISDKSVKKTEEVTLLTDVIQAARQSGSNVCLHVEVGTESLFLDDLQKAGALLIFKSALVDYRSPLKPLEERARKQKLDPSTYYLYPIFL